jgi:hypothetical protein
VTSVRDLLTMRALADAAGLDQFVRQYDRQLKRLGLAVVETAAFANAARSVPNIETRSANGV